MAKAKRKAVRIIKFEAQNIKKLKAIEIVANKYINIVSGGNGAGKTSILDSIEWTLVGAKDITSKPVRRGAQRGIIKLHVGEGDTVDVILERTFYEGGAKKAGRLEVKVMPGKDGSAFEGRRKGIHSPDELQDKLLREISYDPLEFQHMKPKEQYHVLRRISVQDIDLDELDLKIQEAFDARKPFKTKLTQMQAQVDLIQVPEGLPEEKVDEQGLVKQLTEAADYNGKIEAERLRRKGIEDSHDARNERIIEKEKELARLRDEITKLRGEAELTAKTIHGWKPLEVPRDSAKLAEEIENARILNRAIDRRNERKRLEADLEAVTAEHKVLDDAVKEGERRKMEAIANAEYPIPGLGFGDAEVMYNGLPFDQASHAEQIRVSTAIGMRANSTVRVMWIKDGSLLDEESKQLIAEMAYEHDYQVWIEEVDTTGEVGFYIEDGEVKTVNDEPLNKMPAKRKAKKESKDAE